MYYVYKNVLNLYFVSFCSVGSGVFRCISTYNKLLILIYNPIRYPVIVRNEFLYIHSKYESSFRSANSSPLNIYSNQRNPIIYLYVDVLHSNQFRHKFISRFVKKELIFSDMERKRTLF